MIDADKVIARLREQEAVHRRTNRLPYADEYGETADLIESLRKDAWRYRWLRHGDNDEQVLEFSPRSNATRDDVWLLRGDVLDIIIDSAIEQEESER